MVTEWADGKHRLIDQVRDLFKIPVGECVLPDRCAPRSLSKGLTCSELKFEPFVKL